MTQTTTRLVIRKPHYASTTTAYVMLKEMFYTDLILIHLFGVDSCIYILYYELFGIMIYWGIDILFFSLYFIYLFYFTFCIMYCYVIEGKFTPGCYYSVMCYLICLVWLVIHILYCVLLRYREKSYMELLLFCYVLFNLFDVNGSTYIVLCIVCYHDLLFSTVFIEELVFISFHLSLFPRLDHPHISISINHWRQ